MKKKILGFTYEFQILEIYCTNTLEYCYFSYPILIKHYFAKNINRNSVLSTIPYHYSIVGTVPKASFASEASEFVFDSMESFRSPVAS